MARIGTEMIWAQERKESLIATRAAVKKGTKIEQKRIKAGWRYVQVNERTKILVPCDKKGKPTEEGEKKILALKKNLGIK